MSGNGAVGGIRDWMRRSMGLHSPVPAGRVKSYRRCAAAALIAALAGAPASHAAGLTISGPAGAATVLSPQAVGKLPSRHVEANWHGAATSFDGPSLWSVLGVAGAIASAQPRTLVRQAVRITGADGYVAVIALGEISPDFEAKPVILADRQDGTPLPPEHWRVVVPNDRRGGRSVRDVTAIAVVAP